MLAELGAAARRTRVASIEEPGTTRRALVGDQMGLVSENFNDAALDRLTR